MRICGYALAAMVAACPALASDMTPLPVTAPPTSLACYVGAGATGAFVRDTTVVTGFMNLSEGSATWGAEPNGGCDLLFSWGVLGVVGDYEFQNGKSANTFLGLSGSTPFHDTWHINGRLGAYTKADHATLLYLIGGYAGASSSTMTLGPFSSPFSGPHGYDFGVGIETAFGKVGTSTVLAYSEYKHDWYDTQNSALAGLPSKLTTDVDRVTVGLRVKF